MGDVPERRGLNDVEASLARAFAQFGGTSELLDGLEPGAARALRPLVERLEEAGAERCREIGERWAERDGEYSRAIDSPEGEGWERAARSFREDDEPAKWIDSERMRRALLGTLQEGFDEGTAVREERLSRDEEHFDVVVRMEREAFRRFAAELGVFQVARLVRSRNRRRVARVARRFSGRRRELFLHVVRRDSETAARERSRLREVFVTLSRHYDDFERRVEQLGLYSVARAASRRFRGRIERLRRRLSDEIGDRLVRYVRMARRSTRRGVAWKVRESLEEFVRLRRELADEGSDEPGTESRQT